jgi:hypothetical protein
LRSFGGTHVDLRSGKERLDANVDGKSAFNSSLNLAFNDSAFLEDLAIFSQFWR